jgi:hypothetical protein
MVYCWGFSSPGADPTVTHCGWLILLCSGVCWWWSLSVWWLVFSEKAFCFSHLFYSPFLNEMTRSSSELFERKKISTYNWHASRLMYVVIDVCIFFNVWSNLVLNIKFLWPNQVLSIDFFLYLLTLVSPTYPFLCCLFYVLQFGLPLLSNIPLWWRLPCIVHIDLQKSVLDFPLKWHLDLSFNTI